MGIGSILIALVVFLAIVVFHEFGHFIVAKLCGIKVNEFSVGMGPVLLKKKGKETQYSLRLFPIGGFCAMEGEDAESSDPHSFGSRPVWSRIAVVVAGAAMNLILGFLIIIVTTLLYGDVTTLQIAGFSSDVETGQSTSTSETSGLQAGDTILSLDGMHLFTDTDLSYKLQTAESDTMEVVVRRDGKKVTLPAVTFHNTNTMTRFDFYVKAEDLSFLSVVKYGFLNTISTGRLIWSSLIDLLTGKYGFQDMSGPVGIVSTIGEAASYGETFRQHLISVLSLASFITINVGIFNLLPIPALDGARLIFLLVEAVRRKPVKPEYEGMVHFIGMALLMLLMLAVTFQDITRLIQK